MFNYLRIESLLYLINIIMKTRSLTFLIRSTRMIGIIVCRLNELQNTMYAIKWLKLCSVLSL